MICYKDMRFCPFWKRCRNYACRRAYTKTVKSDAGRVGLRVALYADKPGCFCGKNEPRVKR